MADVEIYRHVGGRKLTKIIAIHKDVQDALDDNALDVGARAEALLWKARKSGDSRILIESGRVDRYIVLDDRKGDWAAAAIEIGTGKAKGRNILRRAAGLGGD